MISHTSHHLLIFICALLLTFHTCSAADLSKQGDASQKQDVSITFSQEEAKKVSIIMQTMLPSMFGLFNNITSDDFKANFKEPCRFESLLDLFKQLPPYFDIISAKYPNKPDIAAYYSMQLASTFLVNNGSLTMSCLYNMLSLQTRLMNFSLNIMDNPESFPNLVGLFGVFMKPVMGMLKQNAMMKIIDHVDKYDKNDDISTVYLFNTLNFFYILIGIFGILSNILLVILLKRSMKRGGKKKTLNGKKVSVTQSGKIIAKSNIYETNRAYLTSKSNLKHSSTYSNEKFLPIHDSNQTMQLQPLVLPNTDASLLTHSSFLKSTTSSTAVAAANANKMLKKTQKRSRSRSNKLNKKSKKTKKSGAKRKTSEYYAVKSTNNQFNRIIRKRYKTRLCFIIIAICHSLYLLMNFIVMSQAGLAAVALQGLSQMNLACKVSFFLFPPTTAYNLLHQLAIWLLCYAIIKHSRKLRTTVTHNFDRDAGYEIDLMNSDEDEDSCLDDESSFDEDDDDSSSSSSDEKDNYITKINHKPKASNNINDKANKSYDSLNENHSSTSNNEDTISQSLTNNSQPSSSTQPISNHHAIMTTTTINEGFPMNITSENANANNKCTVQFSDSSPKQKEMIETDPHAKIYSNAALVQYQNPRIYRQQTTHLYVQQPLIQSKAWEVYNPARRSTDYEPKRSIFCILFDRKHKNALFAVILSTLLLIYNSQNIFFYSLTQLKSSPTNVINYCAFEEAYAEYYNMLTQYIVPLLNLFLFSLIPLLLCTVQVLFDFCFLIRVQRERSKHYEKLRDIIEWPLYSYYFVYMVSQTPFAAHQISDLIMGTTKFPFVFPLFIQMKFTSKVWLVMFEMTLIVLAYSSDLFIWLACDKHMRLLAKNWLLKRVLCRTYTYSSTMNDKSKEKNNYKQKAKLSSVSSSTNSTNSHSNCDSNYVNVEIEDINAKMSKKVGQQVESQHLKSNHHKVDNKSSSNGQNNYPSSTMSSTSSSLVASSGGKKKSISPNIVESLKATAALSASASYEPFSETHEPVNSSQIKNTLLSHQQQQGNIRMIDTDNEDAELALNDLNYNDKLAKLDEEDVDVMQKKKKAELDSQPPSFKSAVSKPMQYSSVQLLNNRLTDVYRHQYQNDYVLDAIQK